MRLARAGQERYRWGMEITVIKTGGPPPALAQHFATYPEMFGAMFGLVARDVGICIVDVEAGEDLPDPSSLEAVLITGSAAGVYEDHAWLAPLRRFIRDAFDIGVPMVGVCFGHQIMADALGGTVINSPKGWGLGRGAYRVTGTAPFLAGLGEEIAVARSHQDQVVVPPPGAETILASDFSPHAGLFYPDGPALSVQPHPEFSDDYARALTELRRGRAPEATIGAALASFAAPSDSARLAEAIALFLEAAVAARAGGTKTAARAS